MRSFNPFRVSFDRPLGAGERKRARVAATLVSVSALVFGVAGFSALLSATSATIAAWSNAQPEPQARIVAEAAKGEPAIRTVTRTTGAAVPDHDGDDDGGAAATAHTVPLPQPAPARSVAARAEETPPRNAMPVQSVKPLSKREQRRLRTAERKRLQRERREEAVRLRRERQEEAKRRTARRWTEYPYETPYGGNRLVIRRGSLDDDFFRIIR